MGRVDWPWLARCHGHDENELGKVRYKPRTEYSSVYSWKNDVIPKDGTHQTDLRRAAAARQTLQRLELATRIRPGDSVAVTTGSRGMANTTIIIKAVVDEPKAIGPVPFIIPAMDSHGGGTAERQANVLRHLGIAQESTRAPIKSSMEVAQIGEAFGLQIYLDRIAAEADHIAVVARIKPHTTSRPKSRVVCKMMVIDLWKRMGASICHRLFARYGHSRVLLTIGRQVLKKAKVTFGLGNQNQGRLVYLCSKLQRSRMLRQSLRLRSDSSDWIWRRRSELLTFL